MKRFLFSVLLVMIMSGCARKPYVIVQIADIQLGFTAAVAWQQAGGEYVNDLTYEADFLKKAVAAVNDISPDAVVFSGDQVNMPENVEQWELFSDIISGISTDVKQFHIPGNHDVLLADGRVDCTPFTTRYGDDSFLHCERGVRLIGINTSLIKQEDSRESAQKEWLRKALRKRRACEVTVVFGHHPFFMTDVDEPDSYFPLQPSKRVEYFDLFSEMEVDAVYAGHRHESFYSEYKGIPMRTTTSAAYQIGESRPSIRIITVDRGRIYDKFLEL